MSRYRSLCPNDVIKTLEALRARIHERFPGAGLEAVCDDLVEVAKQTSARISELNQPHWPLRTALVAVIATAFAAVLYIVSNALGLKGTDQLSEVLQGVEAALNLLIVLGGAAFFLSTLETRWNRGRALKALHELRSIVHVIDMHQLTKDPSMIGHARTASSPKRDMSPFELVRYLDYCTEMLSLAGKLAALYAEKLTDPAVVDTVGDIERLTSNLSSKIWQKITIVQQLDSSRELPLPVAGGATAATAMPGSP
jgi:hypothetical protein